MFISSFFIYFREESFLLNVPNPLRTAHTRSSSDTTAKKYKNEFTNKIINLLPYSATCGNISQSGAFQTNIGQ